MPDATAAILARLDDPMRHSKGTSHAAANLIRNLEAIIESDVAKICELGGEIVAYPQGMRSTEEQQDDAGDTERDKEGGLLGIKLDGPIIPDTNREGLEGQREVASGVSPEQQDIGDTCWWETEPDVGRVADGVPKRVDRLRCLGNAVVPQIPEMIGYAILEAHHD